MLENVLKLLTVTSVHVFVIFTYTILEKRFLNNWLLNEYERVRCIMTFVNPIFSGCSASWKVS